MHKESVSQSWDFKKISVGLVVLMILGGVLYYYRAPVIGVWNQISSSKRPERISQRKVAGEKTAREIPQMSSSMQTTMQKKLEALKENVNNLDVKDIATSSPQYQKVLKDVESLKQLPRNEAKQFCEQICKSL